MSTENSRKRIATNTLMLYIRMIFTMLASLYTSRIVLNVLGVEDFGIYNIVGGVVVLFSFFNNAMTSATQRFLTYELGKKDFIQLKRMFSMSMTTHISIIIVILILAETIGLWFLNTQINIPEERLVAANWVYQFSILAFCFQIIQVPYSASIIAFEKMSVYAYISIFEVAFKLLVVLLLKYIPFDKLATYSISISFASFLTFMVYRMFCKRKFDITHYHFFWDKKLYKQLMSFSGWSLFGQISFISANQGINILLNIFYKVTLNAALGIANQVNSALVGFVSNFQTAFKPQITKSFACGDKEYMYQLIFQTSKISYFLLYILAIPILFNIEYLLQLWLKIVPDYTAIFCKLIIIYSLIEAISGPLWMSVFATGHIRNYQIVIGIVILSNLLLSYIFLKLGFAPQVVLWIRIFINVLVLIMRIFYAHKMVHLQRFAYIQNVILPITGVTVLSLPLPFWLHKYAENFIGVLFTSLIYILMIMLCIYFIGMTKLEKRYVNGLIYRYFNKISKLIPICKHMN